MNDAITMSTGYEVSLALSCFFISATLLHLNVTPDTPTPLKRLIFLLETYLAICGLSHLLAPLASPYPFMQPLQHLLQSSILLFSIFASATIYQMGSFFATLPTPLLVQQLRNELELHKSNLDKMVAQHTHELKQEKAKWQLVIEQLPHKLSLKNTKGRVEYFNNKWYEYTGSKPVDGADLEGFLQQYLHPVDYGVMDKKWAQGIMANNIFSDYKIRVKGADNVYRWHLVRCVPLRDVETSELMQYCSIATDIQDTEAVKELSVADATRKSRFLAMISHEMRTPLTGIIGMSTLLGDTALLQPQVEVLNNIKLSADRLLSLVNNILDLFKLHNDKISLELSTFELVDCIQEALAAVREEATLKSINLHDEVEHNVIPGLIKADRGRVKQVLVSVLSNAVKFTPNGGDIYISALLGRANNGKSNIKISVRDTGIGIKEEDTAKIFETFTQLDNSTTRRFGGTGLSLALSKGLVELMHGRIWCESDPGKGATFFFTFEVDDVTNATLKVSDPSPPLLTSTPLLYDPSCSEIINSDGVITCTMPTPREVTNNNTEHEDVSDNSGSDSDSDSDSGSDTDDERESGVEDMSTFKPKILVVDDTDMNQKVLKRFLGSLGFAEVDVVSDGAQAVNAVTTSDVQHPYDVIFMDMEMPIMDGVTATKHIRQLSSTVVAKQPHIVAVTANAFKEDVDRCLEAGMCGHMAKPVKRDDLKKKLERAILILGGHEVCTCHLHHHHHHHHHHHEHNHHHHEQHTHHDGHHEHTHHEGHHEHTHHEHTQHHEHHQQHHHSPAPQALVV